MDDTDFHAMADSLLSGRYNLLIGAGVSLDSTNRHNDKLLSGAAYLKFLSEQKSLPFKYSLHDVYSMLSDDEIDRFVTDIFYECRPGPTVLRFTEYIWNRIFTFNIDDATESAYELPSAKSQQKLSVINFSDNYLEVSDKNCLQIVRLHGLTRRRSEKYVFSKDEYIRFNEVK